MHITQRFSFALIALTLYFTTLLNAAATGDNLPAKRTPISTHVLNTASGKPAAGVAVVLQYQAGKNWEELGRSLTDLQGRAADLYPAKKPLQMGIYRVVYETGVYFKGQGTKTFFPQVEIIFEVEKTDEHYHVPLLLSPFGYSTYRGS
ncbi:MAG: hydroxyisourate hydrolase [Gemmataceae bacterium]